jgi:hypothetical protein
MYDAREAEHSTDFQKIYRNLKQQKRIVQTISEPGKTGGKRSDEALDLIRRKVRQETSCQNRVEGKSELVKQERSS